MTEQELYTVTIRTTCRACAMALAGHAPGLKTIRGAFVTRADKVHIHANSAMVRAHDGSALCCPEHGVTMDLSREPGDAAQRPNGDDYRAVMAVLDATRSELAARAGAADAAAAKARRVA